MKKMNKRKQLKILMRKKQKMGQIQFQINKKADRVNCKKFIVETL
jgi:hypothetical protein